MAEYRRHDALLFPSTYEGFGMVVIEAMSQRLPVIATPLGCARSLVRDGRNRYCGAAARRGRARRGDSSSDGRSVRGAAAGRQCVHVRGRDDLAARRRTDAGRVPRRARGAEGGMTPGPDDRHHDEEPPGGAPGVPAIARHPAGPQPEVLVFDDGSTPPADPGGAAGRRDPARRLGAGLHRRTQPPGARRRARRRSCCSTTTRASFRATASSRRWRYSTPIGRSRRSRSRRGRATAEPGRPRCSPRP